MSDARNLYSGDTNDTILKYDLTRLTESSMDPGLPESAFTMHSVCLHLLTAQRPLWLISNVLSKDSVRAISCHPELDAVFLSAGYAAIYLHLRPYINIADRRHCQRGRPDHPPRLAGGAPDEPRAGDAAAHGRIHEHGVPPDGSTHIRDGRRDGRCLLAGHAHGVRATGAQGAGWRRTDGTHTVMLP